jgi:hypothetical protein
MTDDLATLRRALELVRLHRMYLAISKFPGKIVTKQDKQAWAALERLALEAIDAAVESAKDKAPAPF